MLVRTDETNKHNGITFMLIDMKTPGIEVKPIRLISGNSPFCETFFTDVKARRRERGRRREQRLDRGQDAAQLRALGHGHGRRWAARARRGGAAGARLAAARQGSRRRARRQASPTRALRDQVDALLLDEMALALTIQRSAESRKASGAPGPEISMFKLYASELGHRRDELTLALRGTDALGWEGDGASSEDLDAHARVARAPRPRRSTAAPPRSSATSSPSASSSCPGA